MQNVLTRETWKDAVRDSGIRLEAIAVQTGMSYSSVYRYWNGTRRPSDAWLAQVSEILAGQRRGS